MKCVLCSTTRNTGRYLQNIFKNILLIKNLFDNLVVCFFYDISNDNTLEQLINFKNDYLGECEIIINTEELLSFRTYRIANGRNKLIEFIEQKHADSEYFIMIDSDDICSNKIDIDVLKESIGMESDKWDSLSFNRNDYYDIWALQYEPFIHHCYGFCFPGCDQMISIMKNDIQNKLMNVDNNLFEVYSAFNGFAIYRTKKFLGLRYDGKFQKYFPDEKIINMINYVNKTYNTNLSIIKFEQKCEHISFHLKTIRKNNAKNQNFRKNTFQNFVYLKIQIL